MLRNARSKPPLTQKSLVTLLSVSLSTFLLGGLAGYWVVQRFHAASSEDRGGGPVAVEAPRAPQAQLVRVGSIERQPIVPVKTLVGDLVAVRTATIATEVAGKLIEMPVDEGSQVIGGETLLARIDDTWTNLEVDKITSQIAEKKAMLKFERAELKRFDELVQQRAVSLSEAEQKLSLIEESEAGLAQLHVLLEEANERISRLSIEAPFDGSVVAKHAEIGEYLPIGSPIAEIVSSGRIDARMMVPEESLPLLKMGDSIDLVVDSLAMELRGEIFSINSRGSVGSRTFPVRVKLDDHAGQLRPGMGVSVFVPVTKASTELIVPRDAVLIEPDESTIWILQPSDASEQDASETSQWVAQPVPVRVLSHTRDSYAIASDRKVDAQRLQPGVQVVIEGLERLAPGALVRIDPDATTLVPVPGTYRTGQQIVERNEK